MLDNQEYLDRIKRSEGFLSTQRRCPAGFLSIGYGYNLERYGSTPEAIARAKKEVCKILNKSSIDNGITEAEAQKLLQHDLNRVIEGIKADKRLGPLFEKLDDERQFVLVDMCYNMGIPRTKKFNKMLTAMENGDYTAAAQEILRSKYARDVGRRARDNAACMATGEFEFNTTKRVMSDDKKKAAKKSKTEEEKARKANAGARTQTQPSPSRTSASSGKILNVGDSRTVGMAGENGSRLVQKTDKTGDDWYAQMGKGFAWFKQHLNDIKQDAQDCDCVVVNLGFNDVYGAVHSNKNIEKMAKEYAAQMNEFAAEMKRQGKQVYFTTVNPVSTNRSDAAKVNKGVDDFNRYMQQYLSDDVKIIDTQSYVRSQSNSKVYGSKGGDGIHYTGSFYSELAQYTEQQVRAAEAGREHTQSRTAQEQPHSRVAQGPQTRTQPQSGGKAKTPEQPAQTPAKAKPRQSENSGNASDKDKARMRSMLNKLSKANGKSRQVDVDATIEALSAQYGENASKILAKVMMAPTTMAKKLDLRDKNGKLLTSSRQIIQKLCEIDDEQQKNNVIAMAASKRRRSR